MRGLVTNAVVPLTERRQLSLGPRGLPRGMSCSSLLTHSHSPNNAAMAIAIPFTTHLQARGVASCSEKSCESHPGCPCKVGIPQALCIHHCTVGAATTIYMEHSRRIAMFGERPCMQHGTGLAALHNEAAAGVYHSIISPVTQPLRLGIA